MFEQFSERARRALALAEDEARQLLNGLSKTEPLDAREGKGTRRQILRELQADLARVREHAALLPAELSANTPGRTRRSRGPGGSRPARESGDRDEEALASSGPICPNCRRPLREHLLQEALSVQDASGGAPGLPVSFIYCGACGWTLRIRPGRPQGMVRAGRHEPRHQVADPEDEASPAGQFQLRCRELIAAIEALGFTPGGWIGLINRLGAVQAAKELLSTGRILPVTRWLVEQGHEELTMESELLEDRWGQLFSDDERIEANRRIVESRIDT